MIRTRKRLKSTEDPLAIPPFLDRKLWTEEDWERDKQWLEDTLRSSFDKQQEKLQLTNKRIFAKVKRVRQRKILHEYIRDRRSDKKLERNVRRMQRKLTFEEHDGKVLGLLRSSDKPITVGKIGKGSDLTSREIRRSLKRLIKTNRATKLGSRYYKPIIRERKRLSDVLK